MRISICTFCHGRKREALKTVPLSLTQLSDNDELIFVDYGCPEKTADTLGLLHPRTLKIVRAVGITWFHCDHARNLAGRAAKGDLLLFTDVDHWTPRHVIEEARRIPLGSFGIMPNELANWGWLAIHRCDFYRIQGYEEALTAYGEDDFQMRRSLVNLGRSCVMLHNSIVCVQRKFHAQRNGQQRNGQPEQILQPCDQQFRHHQDTRRSRTNAVNVAVARALRMLHPYKNNVSRNWGWNGTIQTDGWKPDA